MKVIYFYLNFNFIDDGLLYSSYAFNLEMQHVSYILYTIVKLNH